MVEFVTRSHLGSSGVRRSRFGTPVPLKSAEPAPEQVSLTSANFWEETPSMTFPHIRLLAENAALLIVSNAEVERTFNFMRHLLPFTRQGVLLDENFEKEFFLRTNKNFFEIHNLNPFK